jgi:hypothetical protein
MKGKNEPFAPTEVFDGLDIKRHPSDAEDAL